MKINCLLFYFLAQLWLMKKDLTGSDLPDHILTSLVNKYRVIRGRNAWTLSCAAVKLVVVEVVPGNC